MKRIGLLIVTIAVALVLTAGYGMVTGDFTALAALGSMGVVGLGTALTADRNTPRREGELVNMGVAAAKKIYAGAFVMRSPTGYATPGATATGCVGIGRAESQEDNSSGSDGDLTIDVRKGTFRLGNSAGGDEITIADIGQDCYIVDDQTVAKTDGGGTRSVAGRIHTLDSTGVWVETAIVPRASTVGSSDMDDTLIKYITVALSNADIMALRATPKTLVAAPGANKALEFISAEMELVYGSEVLAETADNMAVRYTDGSGAIVSQSIESTGFIDQAADTMSNALPKIDAIVASASGQNKALVLHNTGDGEFTGNASADSTMTVKVAYRVHDFS